MKSHSPKKAPGLQTAAMPAEGATWVVPCICVLLAALVFAVFGQTLRDTFVNYDDNIYVYQNPNVTGGISAGALIHAFTHSDLYLWTPLTTVSHMLDCQFFGLRWPGGHHLTNVLLHAAAVIALFLVLRRMTGARWRSAFVAAVFAIHPLRAESVAWVAERKDVLSGLFFMLTIGAYALYVQKRSVARYAAVAGLFAMGLMAKQMVVTLPCVLLLLDYWPLDRFAAEPGGKRGGMPVFLRLLIEKLPLFALSAASCAQALMAGSKLREVVPVAHPFLQRAGNALVCYIVYIFQMLFPAGLTVFYPFPAAVPAWESLGALALLAGISAGAFVLRGRHPALFTGWFWYLGMLAPVIGFVPVGREGHADRYTYLPQIGLAIAITWWCAAAFTRLRVPLQGRIAAAGMVLAALGIAGYVQTSYWRNDESLWRRALEVAPDNAFAHDNFGLDLEAAGDTDGAIAQYRAAFAIQPDFPEAYNNIGNAFADKGETDAAIVNYRKALSLAPRFIPALINLGNGLSAKGKMDEAMIEYRKVIKIDPDYVDARQNLANTLLLTHRLDEAETEYEKALDLNPGLANARFNLARILLLMGRAKEAAANFEKALRLQPHDADIQIDFAYLLAACPLAGVRDGPRALQLAQEAVENTGGRSPEMLRTLAAALAENGRFDEAAQTAQRALALANPQSQADLAWELRAQLASYQAGKPFRDESMIASGTGSH